MPVIVEKHSLATDYRSCIKHACKFLEPGIDGAGKGTNGFYDQPTEAVREEYQWPQHLFRRAAFAC